jgi:hypothetical protein
LSAVFEDAGRGGRSERGNEPRRSETERHRLLGLTCEGAAGMARFDQEDACGAIAGDAKHRLDDVSRSVSSSGVPIDRRGFTNASPSAAAPL